MMNIREREGVIVIPDFNGFTEFVMTTKNYVGSFIVKQLLTSLIEANDYYFYTSEIEGDAILFYRYNKKPSFSDIAIVLQRMHKSFNNKKRELNEKFDISIEMSLKFI